MSTLREAFLHIYLEVPLFNLLAVFDHPLFTSKMEELRQYLLQNELVESSRTSWQSHTSRTVLRAGIFEPIHVLPLLQNLPFFAEMDLPRAVLLSIANCLELHLLPHGERIVEVSGSTLLSSPVGSPDRSRS